MDPKKVELKEAERSLGVQFPELFHAICNSGMMDHLSLSKKGPDNKNTIFFFGEFMGDCRLIAFEELCSACEELYACLDLDLEIYPERQSINPLYRLVPFARKISGDKYCFLYEEGVVEPKVVLYGHDTGDIDLWADSFEEFIFFQIVEELADGDRELHSDYIRAHIRWLNDTHKQMLIETPVEDIWDQLPEPQELNIWVSKEPKERQGVRQ